MLLYQNYLTWDLSGSTWCLEDCLDMFGQDGGMGWDALAQHRTGKDWGLEMSRGVLMCLNRVGQGGT